MHPLRSRIRNPRKGDCGERSDLDQSADSSRDLLTHQRGQDDGPFSRPGLWVSKSFLDNVCRWSLGGLFIRGFSRWAAPAGETARHDPALSFWLQGV